MQTAERYRGDTGNSAVDVEPSAAEVHVALEQILESQPFRTSRQCQKLLRYIVDRSLQGEDGSLRERILGVEVFGRPADYDTAEDPVVRMRAADVRKRLAQFYQAADPQPIHIGIKPGSYRAAFSYLHPPDLQPVATPAVLTSVATPAPTPALTAAPATSAPAQVVEAVLSPFPTDIPHTPDHPHRRPPHQWRLLLGLALLLLLAALAGVALWAWATRPASAQLRFWAPLTQAKHPVLLYLGANAAYRFTPAYMDRYQQQHGLKENGPEFFPALPPGTAIRSEDLVPQKGTFVTVSDTAAAIQVSSLLNRWSRPFVLRAADDLSMGDLRDTPAIFIGGFNNRWGLSITDQLPLAFRNGTTILDQAHPEHRWVVDPNVHRETMEDYALVSRVLHGKAGGPILSVGGIGSFGTQAAAEFVCNPEKMNELLNAAPKNWNGENVQAVLRIQVVNYTPVKVDIVKTVFW